MNAVQPPQLPFPREGLFVPAAKQRELQRAGTVHRVTTAVGDPAWLITGYATVRRLFDDERVGRSHPEPDTAARSGDSAFFGGPIGSYETEREDHARARRLMQPHFTPKQMRTLAGRVHELADELITAMIDQGSPADFYTAVAVPLPMMVLCELLGVPYADRDEFREWTVAASNTRDRSRSEWGMGQLFVYGMQLVGRKRKQPGDDVISRLCAIDGVADHEIASQSMALLLGGHETTVVQLGLATLLLLANPEQWALLVSQPDLVPNAVEETLRASRTGGGEIPRYAREDLEIDGVHIAAGELLLLDVGAANQDPAVFGCPDQLDVARKHLAHVIFGYGSRYCVGAPLARMQLTEVLGQLVERVPGLHLRRDISELTMRGDLLTGGLREVPVGW
ncbi:cytochrome P450 [Mycobacteroides abscessus]|uniref:cytochrome P450 n=1 Tax=Mycobacteroides abscessus TaxID=36809 RepID=UPI0013F62BBB|nr:cytochrome P450 [Mycobacteroides abscessus]